MNDETRIYIGWQALLGLTITMLGLFLIISVRGCTEYNTKTTLEYIDKGYTQANDYTQSTHWEKP